MRPQLFKHLKPDQHKYQRNRPEVERHRRAFKEPVSRHHTVPVACRNVIKGIELKHRSKPGRSVGKDFFIIHNRCQPHAELQADSNDLGHILKKHLNRAVKNVSASPSMDAAKE